MRRPHTQFAAASRVPAPRSAPAPSSALMMNLERRCDRIRGALVRLDVNERGHGHAPRRVHRHEQAYRTPASVDAMLTAAAIAGASSDPRVATRDEAIAAQSQSQTWAPRNTQLHDDVNRLVNLLPNLSSRTYGVTGPWLEGQQETYMCSVNRAVSCLPQLSSPWADVRSGVLPFYGNARPFPHGSSPARPTITRSAAASAGKVTHEAAHLQRLREIRRIGDAALSYEYT